MGLIHEKSFMDDARRWQREMSDAEKAHLKKIVSEAVRDALAEHDAFQRKIAINS